MFFRRKEQIMSNIDFETIALSLVIDHFLKSSLSFSCYKIINNANWVINYANSLKMMN
nr:hypothetical protein [Mycoplasmopsis agalactiae]